MPTRRSLVVAGAAVAGAAAARGAWAAAPAPVAMTRHGPVRGYVDRGINVFRGIRYGTDTATRRFQPPLAPARWREVRDATRYGHACIQQSDEADQSEDCLFLNVWTPGLNDRARRPVMVYVHGGAHANGSGSSPLYDGVNLCRRGDVVVVTINHRLNIFGYNGLGQILPAQFGASGSVGNLDIILALQWVRDSIASFGGDPGNVTVFGQSGGGAKLVTLMAMPLAAGLFHRVITMSGQHVTAMGPRHAELRTRKLLDHFGIAPARAAALATLPVARLREALSLRDPIEEGEMYFWSVMDHRTLPRHPFVPDAPRESGHIPMIVGNTHDERSATRADTALGWDELPARIGPQLAVDLNAQYIVDWYRAKFPAMTPADVITAALTCGRSRPGHLIQAEERAKLRGPTWMYQLDFGSPTQPLRGAYHGIDIPLAFDNLGQPGAGLGNGAEARRVAATLASTFIAFARSGDPDNPAIPTWPRYTLPERSTLIVDARTRVEDDPRREERLLFQTAPFLKLGT